MTKGVIGLFDLKYVYMEAKQSGEIDLYYIISKLEKHNIPYVLLDVVDRFSVSKTILSVQNFNLLDNFVELKECIIFFDDSDKFVEELLINNNDVSAIEKNGVMRKLKEEYEEPNRNHFLS